MVTQHLENSWEYMLIPTLTNWISHGDVIAAKLCKNNFLLRSLYNEVPLDTLRIAYFCFVQAHLSYGLLLWGHSSARHRAFSLQRRPVRILGGLPY